MTHVTELHNQLLLAMPQMDDEQFQRAVIYLCEHNDRGTLGLVINRPLEMGFSDVLIQLGHVQKEAHEPFQSRPILWGGPCSSEKGFVLHRQPGNWKTSFIISDEVTLTASQDIITSLAQGNGPEESLIAFGCSRWDPGQLEQELLENLWLTVPMNDFILYECPFQQRWGTAGMTQGIDFKRMSYDVGHA